MFQFTDLSLRLYFKHRQKHIDAVIRNPFNSQKEILKRIIKHNLNSNFGMAHNFKDIDHVCDYHLAVPLNTYESLFPFIEKMMDGGKNELVSSEVAWFAKSSGTSTGRSKYIPVTKNYLKNGHLKCAWDAASFIYNEDPQAKLFAYKSLIMGGSIETLDNGQIVGDISGIIIHQFPQIGRRFYTPDFETALLDNWDLKINKMAKIVSKENVTLLAGVPSWTIVLLNKVLEITKANNISEVWPNLRSYLHGGIGFEPYRSTFTKLIPSDNLALREVYNASEGYFSIQNNKDEDGMLLLCDHEIYYEFIPMLDYDPNNPKVINLSEVKNNESYALVISNTSGLYRYIMGDIIEFTSVNPYKIKVVGRLNEQINAFGEEVSAHNTDQALALTCDLTHSIVSEYTVCPKPMNVSEQGRHEWYIEFKKEPQDIYLFKNLLDENLRQINSDYDAKRSYDLVIKSPHIEILKPGTFEKWLRSKNKFGGQNKIPRLRNDRQIVDELLANRT